MLVEIMQQGWIYNIVYQILHQISGTEYTVVVVVVVVVTPTSICGTTVTLQVLVYVSQDSNNIGKQLL